MPNMASTPITSPPVGHALDREHREWHERRQCRQREQEIDPDADALDRLRDVALETEPDERLVDLMQPEQQRERRQHDLFRFANVAERVRADDDDDSPDDRVGAGGKAHATSPTCKSRVGPRSANALPSPSRPARTGG